MCPEGRLGMFYILIYTQSPSWTHPLSEFYKTHDAYSCLLLLLLL
jgi:hypothetical protein